MFSKIILNTCLGKDDHMELKLALPAKQVLRSKIKTNLKKAEIFGTSDFARLLKQSFNFCFIIMVYKRACI